MGRNAVLRRLVHLKSTDLDLKRLPVAADQRGMQRLVHIGLGHGDIVLEPPGNGRIPFMDHSQRRIAVLHRFHNNPHRKQIINLVQGFVLVFHLFIDAEKMFDPAVHLGADALSLNKLLDLVHDALDIFLTNALAHGDFIHQVVIYLRLQIFHGQVVQFDLDLGDAQPLGDGRIDFPGLPGDTDLALRLLVFQRAHIVQTVRQLDHDHPDILGHGQKHLPQILRLHLQLGIRGVAGA